MLWSSRSSKRATSIKMCSLTLDKMFILKLPFVSNVLETVAMETHVGIKGTALNLFQSYLSNRSFSVSFGPYSSFVITGDIVSKTMSKCSSSECTKHMNVFTLKITTKSLVCQVRSTDINSENYGDFIGACCVCICSYHIQRVNLREINTVEHSWNISRTFNVFLSCNQYIICICIQWLEKGNFYSLI